MNEIFADAFYWIALASPADEWHNAVKNFDRVNPAVLIITTQEVFTEFLNYFSEAGKYRRSIAGQMCTQVLAHSRIVVLPQSHDSFARGLALYQNRKDKGYSLTDCISMNVCRDRAIADVLTHDDHFAQEGFKVYFR
jgi:uncharacterized protein